jgi:prepilin-type N-terminal cleavage/methylation domain-containing protein
MQRTSNGRGGDGFTLVEVVVALALVLVCAAGVGQLIVVALSAARHAREDSVATLLAAQKIEELRGAAAAPSGLTLSPDNALESDVPGFSDRVDASGAAASSGTSGRRTATFVRRWRVRPLASGTATGWVFHVVVMPAWRGALVGASPGRGTGADGDAHLMAVRTMR